MWDNPRLLNGAAGFLVGLTVLACAFAGGHWMLRSSLFPLRAVELSTPVKHASRPDIEAVLAQAGGNFFAAGIAELRAALEQLPWVRRASVRRVWPDRLVVAIEEHVALARWGNEALVNTHGERFAGTTQAQLPVFLAPAGTEAEVTRRFARFRDVLAPLGTPLERVVLTPRHAWQLRLANGLQIMLGRDAELAEQRLQRFVGLYPSALGARQPANEVVDLRYPNGFAWRARS